MFHSRASTLLHMLSLLANKNSSYYYDIARFSHHNFTLNILCADSCYCAYRTNIQNIISTHSGRLVLSECRTVCMCSCSTHTKGERASEREIHKYGTHIRCQNFVKTISAARISICFSYETVTSQVLQ